MKIDFNRNYGLMALYALVVILCGILFIFAFSNFGLMWTYLVNFLSIFMPIFYGMFIAYLIYPIIKFFEWRVFRGLNRRKKYGLARALSVVSSFCIVIAVIVLFCWLIFPHIIEGYVDLQRMSSMYMGSMKEWLFSLSDGTGALSGYISKFSEYFSKLGQSQPVVHSSGRTIKSGLFCASHKSSSTFFIFEFISPAIDSNCTTNTLIFIIKLYYKIAF